MRKTFIIFGIVFLTFVIGVFSYVSYHFLLPGYGAVIEQREISNGTFKVRVQKRPALYSFAQYYYVLQSSPAESHSWREVLSHLRDEPTPLRLEQLRFVNEQVGYFFIDDFLAVTDDGGQSWTQWKPKGLGIEDLVINVDGKGAAKLWNYDYQLKSRVYRTAYTIDYGKNWNLE